MFKITDQKGFHITFANGYTVSVQFGRGNYCDNYNLLDSRGPVPASRNAEVAIWGPGKNWYHPICFVDLSGDDVYPEITPARLLEVLNEVAALEATVTEGTSNVG